MFLFIFLTKTNQIQDLLILANLATMVLILFEQFQQQTREREGKRKNLNDNETQKK